MCTFKDPAPLESHKAHRIIKHYKQERGKRAYNSYSIGKLVNYVLQNEFFIWFELKLTLKIYSVYFTRPGTLATSVRREQGKRINSVIIQR